MIACRTAALQERILGERRERATRQANNAILVHRNNLSRIYNSYTIFAGFLACVQTSPVFVPSATKKEVARIKLNPWFHTNNALFGVNDTALLILCSGNCCCFFFTRKNIVPSRKISDVRMPRIPSVSTTNSNPGSRSSSGLVVREQSREQLLG